MKVAFLANGRTVHTVKWVRYFADRGCNAHLITFTSKPIKDMKIDECARVQEDLFLKNQNLTKIQSLGET